MPFPSLPKRNVPSEAEGVNKAPEEPTPVVEVAEPRSTPKLVESPAPAKEIGASREKTEVPREGDPAQRSKAAGAAAQRPGKQRKDNSDDSAPEEESRWEWVRPVVSAFMEAGLPIQVAVVGAILVPTAWAAGVFDVAKKPSAAASSVHRISGFGPEGYPLVPVSERRVTDKDVAVLLKHSAARVQPDIPSDGRTPLAGPGGVGAPSSEQTRVVYVERDQGVAPTRAGGVRVPRRVQAPPVVTEAKRRSARLYSPGGTLKGAAQKEAQGLKVPAGTRIEVVLEVGVSSSHRGTVMGRVEKDVVSAKGDVLISAGDLLKGSARADFPGGRMFLDFTQLVRGDKSSRLEGYAVAGGEAGVPAERHESNARNKQENALTGGSLDTVQDVASGLPNLVRNIARRSVSEAKKDLTSTTSVTLSLPSQTRFEVFITG